MTMVISVTNRKLCKDNFTERVKNILDAEPFLVILREKDLTDIDYEKLAKQIISEDKSYCKILSLNRPIIALKLGIENTHLTISYIRENGRPEGIKRVGVSIHSAEEAVEAQKLGADYLIAGHIYKTDCKKGVEPRGLEFLENVVKSVDIPVFAIGGICMENYLEPFEKGVYGVCLMSEFMTCENPYERVMKYQTESGQYK